MHSLLNNRQDADAPPPLPPGIQENLDDDVLSQARAGAKGKSAQYNAAGALASLQEEQAQKSGALQEPHSDISPSYRTPEVRM